MEFSVHDLNARGATFNNVGRDQNTYFTYHIGWLLHLVTVRALKFADEFWVFVALVTTPYLFFTAWREIGHEFTGDEPRNALTDLFTLAEWRALKELRVGYSLFSATSLDVHPTD